MYAYLSVCAQHLLKQLWAQQVCGETKSSYNIKVDNVGKSGLTSSVKDGEAVHSIYKM